MQWFGKCAFMLTVLGPIQHLPLSTHVTLSKFFESLVDEFPYLQNKDHNSTAYLTIVRKN